MALGCNIFNMGFLACFAAYPFVFKPLEKNNKPVLGAILASVAALQLASIAVVIESALSGTIALSSLAAFTKLMQAIHLPIGIIEGLITGAILALSKVVNSQKLAVSYTLVSVILAGFISQYASTKPDGLEWSLLNISSAVTENTEGILYNLSVLVQTKTSILANFAFGSITGLLAVGIFMYLICVLMTRKTVKENV